MIILASASPRRRELLSRITCDFEVVPSGASETTTYRRPHLYVRDLAERKAESVAVAVKSGDTVIAADTIVYFKGKVLNKPRDAKEAADFLRMLSGKKHSVYTGICVIKKGRDGQSRKESYYCRSIVEFNVLSEDFIAAYVKSGSPLDKAGAYGIQDKGVVKRVTGDRDNVVGLPLERLRQILGD